MKNDMESRSPWITQTINTGSPDFLAQAGLDSKIIKEPISAGTQIIPDMKALIRLKDSQFYRVVPADFEVLQPDEFYNLTKTIGGMVHSAGETENGEITWFLTVPKEQYQTFQINNDIYQNYILFALSYNANIGIAILPVSINVSQNLIYNVSEMLQVDKPHLRQSKNVKSRTVDTTDFEDSYRECLTQILQFKRKLNVASQEKINTFTDILDSLFPIENLSGNKLTRVLNMRDEVESNHNSLYGTSTYSMLTAIYATDMSKHDKRRLTLARRFFSGKTSPLTSQIVTQIQEDKVA